MAIQEIINNSFEEHENICVMASYSTIIEYFSNKKITIEQVLSSYFEKYLSDRKSEFSDIKKRYNLIFDHFHKYCGGRIRGFDFVKMLHENNELNTRKYCKIYRPHTSLKGIDDNCKELIRNFLKTHDALIMVLYKVPGGNHAVTIGYDSDNKNYFYKDSNNPKYRNGDILPQKEITEYIIFINTKEKITVNENFLLENIAFLLKDAPLNYFYGKEVYFSSGFIKNKSILFQMLGNLGVNSIDNELDNSINVFVSSDSLYNQILNGYKDDILKMLEKRINSKWELFENPLIITESSLIDFVKKRVSFYDDKVTQELINSL